ncbi:MAG: S8 family serine peptidase, partial [Verrucomicrobiota bacterium]
MKFRSAALVGLLAVAAHAGTVDPWVMTQTEKGEAEFLVVLHEQADLRGAAQFASKAERGWFVYTKLLEAADRSQKPVLDHLDRLKVKYRPYWIANMVWVRGPRRAVEALAHRPDVAHISANPSVQHRPLPVAPQLARSLAVASIEWNITKIHAPDVWSLGYTGQTVVVAGQDTGYQWNHPALINKYRGYTTGATNHNYNWHDSIHGLDVHNSGSNPCGYNLLAPCDDHGHGTHTMGTMVGDDEAGNQIGVAPAAQWIGCRNMERGWGTPATYAECFQWFIAPTDLNNLNPNPDLAPDVINNSWGCPPSEGCTDPTVLQTIVENTRAAGIVVVVSAGNAGSGCSSVADPAAIYDASFSVGATSDTDTIADFSSRGPVTVDGSNRPKPDIAAPGVNIRSSVPTSTYAGGWSGTSMAGPHIAGLIALLISAHPEMRGQVDAIETLIEQTAVPRTTPQTCGGIPGSQIPNNTYGWGRADALAALGLSDRDGDGFPDWQEALAGTALGDALSLLRITDVTANGTVTFTTVSNKFYRLERSATLATNDWTTVTNNIAGTGSSVT